MIRFRSLRYHKTNSINGLTQRHITGGEIFGLIFSSTISNILTLMILGRMFAKIKNPDIDKNLIKNINPSTNLYVFDIDKKNKVDNILFFCDDKIKLKLKQYEKKIHINDINTKNYILLSGPPGCGKTHLGSYIANKTNKQLISVDLSELISPWIGDDASRLNKILKNIDAHYNNHIIIFDEIDTIISHRKYDSGGTKNASATVNVLLTWLDGVNTSNNDKIILFTTNKKDALSNAFVDRMTYTIDFKCITKEQLREYWKAHLTHLKDYELDELSEIPLESFRIAKNILKFTIIEKIKKNDSSNITVEEIKNTYINSTHSNKTQFNKNYSNYVL